jgi:hypothetical protein
MVVDLKNVSPKPFEYQLITNLPREFLDENGGGPGVRLRKRHQKKS